MSQTQVIASSSSVSGAAPTFVANHQYKIGRKIGEGSFGVVFEGVSVATGQTVAIKFESRKSECPQLRDEYRSYRTLAGTPGIPQVYYYGVEGLHNVLIMDMCGLNLEDLFDICGRKYSLKTVCMLAKQMLSRVQAIHEKFLIYRDIKPDNFLVGPSGSKTANLIHVVDFGMAKHYKDPRTKIHIPYRERKSLSGTARYMSINTHLGREQSRRDDLESLGHVFLYFLRGSLPWQGLKAATNRQKYERIGEKKQNTPIAELCEGFPEEIAIYMNYVRKLGFEETPDYDFLRELFTKALKSVAQEDDNAFDWATLNGGKGWEGNATTSSSAAHPARRDRDRERERHREKAGHQALPTTPNLNPRGPLPNNPGDATPSPLILTPASAVVAPHVPRRDRERERRRLDTSASGAAVVGASPIATRRSSGQQHTPPTHPYASTTGAVHAQTPTSYRAMNPAQNGDAFAYGGRLREASNVALVGGTPPASAVQSNMRRAMSPLMANGHVEMGRPHMSTHPSDRDRGRMDDAGQGGGMNGGHKGGFMSLICCR